MSLKLIPSLLLAASACGAEAPRYLVTATPIEVGGGPRLCVAVDASDPAGLWWWGPGRTGCATRSTGPGLMRGDRGAVVPRAGAAIVDARFRLGLHALPGSPDHVDVHLEFTDGDVHAPATGARVAAERRSSLDIPERP